MSPRRRRRTFGDWYIAPAKQPVPAAGIAVGRFGDTWWGREWIAALERLGRSWANRLPRGRSYARAGRVVDLEVGPGRVTAGVVGTRRRPYRVEIVMPPYPAEVWDRALEAVASDALTVIRLLRRELPEELGERLREAGADLFPRRGELTTGCSCPDIANPCKHVAAVHYLFAAALDNDPFLILRLRGLDSEALIAAVSGAAEVDADRPLPARGPDALEPAGELDPETFVGSGRRPPVLEVEPRPPRAELVGLRRLGPPPRGFEGLVELLAPTVRAASKHALKLAWSEPDPAPEEAAGDEPDGRRTRRQPGVKTRGRASSVQSDDRSMAQGAGSTLAKRVERLLADTRRPLSRREIATRLKADPEAVVAALTELRRARLVTTEGRGPATRYLLAPTARTTGGAASTSADLADRSLEALRAAGRPLTLRELAEALGAPVSNVRPVVTALRQNGVVEMVGRRRSARYRIRD